MSLYVSSIVLSWVFEHSCIYKNGTKFKMSWPLQAFQNFSVMFYLSSRYARRALFAAVKLLFFRNIFIWCYWGVKIKFAIIQDCEMQYKGINVHTPIVHP